MGRTKGTHIRMLATKLLTVNPDSYDEDFKHNKDLVKEQGFFPQSKLEQNKLAGLLTTEKKKENRIKAEENQEMAA